jgi:uncharacterized protein involved in exopolysaccharide biosynthesis
LILRSRIWLIVLVAVTTVAAGTYFTLTQPKEYLASAAMLLTFNAENPFKEDGLAPQLADSYMATQVDIITSRSVVNRVIDTLGLAETPEQRTEWTYNLLRKLEVEAARESRLVFVQYQSPDPQFSADVANAFARAYVATTQALAVEPAIRNTKWFDAQIDLMRDRLASAQSRMTSFQQEEGIVALDDRLDTQMTRLNELTNQLVEAQGELYDARSRQLGVNHPDYVRAVQREQALQESLEEQKQLVLALRQQRDELQVLAREVNVEEEAYSQALQSYYNAQLLSSYGQTSVEILDDAVPPAEPSSPNVALNIIGSVLLGLMLATMLAVAAELAFRKIREPEDIGELLDTRMLSSV